MSSESDELREFARRKFGSQAKLAHALGVTPQSLNPYYNGRKGIGEELGKRLNELGFQARAYAGLPPHLDWAGLELLIERSLEDVAPTLGIPAEQIKDWKAGGAIQSGHLIRVVNLAVALCLARIGIKVSGKVA